jgi:hypothetical protein
MTSAQKAAKEKFSKAIAYRSKTGVSLKEAFAHVYGKKVGAVKKKAAPKKKAAVKKVLPVKAAPKKAAPKKKAVAKKVTGSHKDTKSHNVNIRVVSGDSIGEWGKAEKYSYKLAIEYEGKFKQFLILFQDRLKNAKSPSEKKFYRIKIINAKKMIKEFQNQQKALLSIK